jgi:hypothetical protein
LALPLFEARYPDDKRPRDASETALRWTDGNATLDEVRTDAVAAYAAYAAYADAAYADAAAAAATAYAAYAAYADAAAAYAAYAAYAAAAYADAAAANAVDAVDAVAARAKMRCRTADVVRQIITVEIIENALTLKDDG